MKKFQQNVSRELKRAYPDRRKLEMQCITAIAFAKNDMELLNCPCWVMIVNIVAMDMLKSKMPPVSKRSDIRNRPRIPIPDEDPYSVAGSGSSGSSSHNGNSNGNGTVPTGSNGVNGTSNTKRADKPPKLPPRDSGIYGSNIPKVGSRWWKHKAHFLCTNIPQALKFSLNSLAAGLRRDWRKRIQSLRHNPSQQGKAVVDRQKIWWEFPPCASVLSIINGCGFITQHQIHWGENSVVDSCVLPDDQSGREIRLSLMCVTNWLVSWGYRTLTIRSFELLSTP